MKKWKCVLCVLLTAVMFFGSIDVWAENENVPVQAEDVQKEAGNRASNDSQKISSAEEYPAEEAESSDANAPLVGETFQDYTIPGTSSYLYYTLDEENHAIIRGCSDDFSGALEIPQTIDGKYTVTAIGHDAFNNNTGVTSITIPSTVTEIGDCAFYSCTGLTGSLTIPGETAKIGGFAFYGCSGIRDDFAIPEGVVSLGYGAFSSCDLVRSISIPSTVTSISPYTFGSDSLLTEIKVSADNTVYASSDGTVYSKDMTKLVSYPAGKENTDLAIPTGVTVIGAGAFYGCAKLTNVTLPESLTEIDFVAFSFCNALTSITIPASVKVIYDTALNACSSLENIWISPESEFFSSIDGVLFDKMKTKLLVYPQNHGASYEVPSGTLSIEGGAFDANDKLTDIKLSDTVRKIAPYTFEYCSGIANLTLSASLTDIGEGAFDGCTGIKDVYYSGTEQDWNAVSTGKNNECLITANVHLNDGIKTAAPVLNADQTWNNGGCVISLSMTCADGAKIYYTLDGSEPDTGSPVYTAPVMLYDDTTVKAKTVKEGAADSFTETKEYTFYYILYTIPGTNITLTIDKTDPDHVKVTGCNQDAAGEVVFPDEFLNKYTITGIDGVGFYNCTGITGIKLPSSVTKIGDSCFSGCTGLSYITGLDSVTSIGNNAFYNCGKLTSISLPSVISIGPWPFLECNAIKTIELSNCLRYLSDGAFTGLKSVEKIVLPYGVTDIPYMCFADCDTLKTLIIPTSVKTIAQDSLANTFGNSVLNIYYTGSENDWNKISNGNDLHNITMHYNFSDPSEWDDFTYTVGTDGNVTITGYTHDLSGTVILPAVIEGHPVTEIGEGAFFNCQNITSVAIPSTVKKIGSGAFRSSKSITRVNIPDSVTVIEKQAFDSCTGLLNITIPDSVQSIGPYAFASCVSLKSFAIPASVSDISPETFLHDSGLEKIEVDSGNTSYYSFDGVLYNKSMTELLCCPEKAAPDSFSVPYGVEQIDEYAFYDSTFRTIEMSKSVKEIFTGAFSGCSNLKDVYYYGNKSSWEAVSVDSENDSLKNAAVHFMDAYLLSGTKKVKIDAGIGTVVCGENLKLTVVDADTGKALDSSLFKWSGSDEASVTVAADGMVTANKTGMIQISVQDDLGLGLSAEAAIAAVSASSDIALTNEDGSSLNNSRPVLLRMGRKLALNVTLGNAGDTLSSCKSSEGTIINAGLTAAGGNQIEIEGLKPGTAFLEAVTSENAVGACAVKVYRPGDVTEDDETTVSDLQEIAKDIVGLESFDEEQIVRGNYNEDLESNIDVSDLQGVARYIVGLDQ